MFAVIMRYNQTPEKRIHTDILQKYLAFQTLHTIKLLAFPFLMVFKGLPNLTCWSERLAKKYFVSVFSLNKSQLDVGSITSCIDSEYFGGG